MAKNFKLSPSIWFATTSLTLLNLAVFVFFGIMQKHMLAAGAACFLFQVFVITHIAFPNFYYLKIKDHLIADIAQTHALGVKQEHTKKQFLDATRTNFSQLSTETGSRLSEIENLQSELASDSNRKLITEIRNTEKSTLSQTAAILESLGGLLKLAQNAEQLAKESRSVIERLESSQTDSFDSLTAAHSKAMGSLSVDHTQNINDLKNSQEQSYGTLAKVIEAGYKSLEEQQRTLQAKISDLTDNLYSNFDKNNATTNELITSNAAQTSEIARKIETDLQRLAKDLPARIENAYERIDALLSLHQVIEIAKPLPIMHDWRISSDYAAALVKTILDSNGGTVIDVGSGVSTIVMGYAAKQKGNTRVVSLEHSEEYFDKTRKLVEEHELQDYCEVLLCPLREFTIDGKKWLWYDIDGIKFNSVIMISVDGPPGVTQRLARYPALRLLERFINDDTIVLLDDANRTDEEEIAAKWQIENQLECEKVDSHKGYFRLAKAQ